MQQIVKNMRTEMIEIAQKCPEKQRVHPIMGCGVSGVIVGNPQIHRSSAGSNTQYRYNDKDPRKGTERILSIGGEPHQEEQQCG